MSTSSDKSNYMWSDSIFALGSRVTATVPISESVPGLSYKMIIKKLQVALSVAPKGNVSYVRPGDEISLRAHTAPSALVTFLGNVDNSLGKSSDDITGTSTLRTTAKTDPVFLLSAGDYFFYPANDARAQHFILTNTKLEPSILAYRTYKDRTMNTGKAPLSIVPAIEGLLIYPIQSAKIRDKVSFLAPFGQTEMVMSN
ncbi:uncharacterized protein LOC129590778 [Paramacrobiotus metropolitanus]|uniref:uncharacterized protein LOC129590778 n=1 Tax=Paramacrobiotus metropolitanus TaxID=2943436 RepID=UPI0024461F87|nr:uncharacterized protein LOC129590778 [Paramacrobiotus metropolitanus]